MGPYPNHSNNFGTDLTSGPSGIWSDCPFDEVRSGYHPGFAKRWDFVDWKAASDVAAAEAYWADGLMVFGSTGSPQTMSSDPTQGTGTVAANAFGVATSGSDGDNEGGAIRMAGAPFKISGPNATATARSGKLWFEARVKQSSIADTLFDWYIGLTEDVASTAAIPITATAGQLADKNLCGFLKLGSDGDQFDAVYKANGTPSSSTHTTALADAQVIVADTWVKLGLKYDPATYRVTWYGNGTQLTTYTTAAAQGTVFPNDVLLGWVIGSTNVAGSITATWSVDWVQACQIPVVI